MENVIKSVELVADARAVIGEGPWWDSRSAVLYWIDIKGKCLHQFHAATGEDTSVRLSTRPGSLVGRESGGLLAAMEDGFLFVDPETGESTPIYDPESSKPGNRFNDGKCDSRGRFWAGTMDDSEKEATGSLYRFDPDRSCMRWLNGVRISNGLAWSLDDRLMYYIDTPTGRVDVFDYDIETGCIAGRRVAFEVPPSMGKPDGMTIDEEGMLWVALWGGWGLGRWDPRSGRLIGRVELPVEKVTCCAFGGSSPSDRGGALDRLYITTAAIGLDAAESARQPHAGGLFAVEPGVGGLPSAPFAG